MTFFLPNNMKDLYQVYKRSKAVSIDTRTIKGGELFFCLKGDHFNGNKFALQALEKGASFVVVDDEPFYSKDDKRMIFVKDSLKSLQSLAKYHREQLKIPLIGITGTNGKTTTKELVSVVLGAQLNCLFTQGNYNNHIGVPLTLLRITENHEVAVVEMGANHPHEIVDLCQLAQPNLGLITNIGRAHLEGFGSFENIIETKTALYRSVEKNSGLLFVNADDDLLMNKSLGAKRIEYSSAKNSDVQLKVEPSDTYLKFRWDGHIVQTQLFGEYNLYNAAAAISIGKYFNIPKTQIIQSLERYQPSNNRSQIERGKNNTLILDAYNDNPDSMKQALRNFSFLRAPKKAMVLGDMLELGSYEKAEHESILQLSESLNIELVFFIGPAFYFHQSSYPQFVFFKDNLEAKEYFKINHLIDYRILLKGSRGIKLEILKEDLL